MSTLLKYLSGKKGVIGTVLALTLGYVYAKGYIDDTTYAYLGGIQVAIFGATSMATKSLYRK